MILFPACKINLGLRILKKRSDGYHDLETVFYPVAIHDALEIIEIKESTFQFTTSGLPINGSIELNLCVKAYNLLKKEFPNLPPVHIHLHKNIPMGAGLGGGSSNGAATLLVLNSKLNLGLSENQLIDYALQLGSDCPFFIVNKPCFATGRGEHLTPVSLNLSLYQLVIINPGIHVSTAWAFSQSHFSANQIPLQQIIDLPITEWKHQLINDFEQPVFKHHLEIKILKALMYQQGALYASMTGSGSTVFGIFEKSETPVFNLPDHYFIKNLATV